MTPFRKDGSMDPGFARVDEQNRLIVSMEADSNGTIIPPVSVTLNYSAGLGDRTIFAKTVSSTGNIAITLPANADVKPGKRYTCRNIGTGIMTITDSVNGSTNTAYATRYSGPTVEWTGTEYISVI